MRTLSEICQSIRSNKSLAKILPDRLFRSIPVPAITPDGIGIGFYYYLAGGKPGEPKTLFPPIFRIVLDRNTEELIELDKAPSIWMPSHQATTRLGSYPSTPLQGLNRSEMDALYEEYYAATENLIESTDMGDDLTGTSNYLKWRTLYEKVHEEGFEPYFATFLPALGETGGSSWKAEVSASESDGRSVGVSPPFSLEHLRNEAARVMTVMDQAKKHIQELNDLGLKREWTRLRQLIEAPSFSVAVAGEFNRGKTTLVNKLLGTRLPEGDLPTTALLTRILYGEKEYLTWVDRSGKKQVMDTSDENLAALQADNDGNDPQGVLVLEIPNSWLGDRRLAIIDTPGAGDLTEHRAEIAAEAVMGADAAIITVSATMPLSLSERAYVEEHVFAKKVPKVAVAITKLDLITENERQTIVDNIVYRVKSWQPQAMVWLANDDPEIMNKIDLPIKGISGIKKAIEHWRADPEHLVSRQRQIQTQLRELLELLTVSLTTRIELARANHDEIEAEQARLRRAVDAESLGWGDLEIEMNRRAGVSADMLGNHLFESENTLQERLLYQLSRAPNPKEWWEKDLPFHLCTELKSIHRQLSGTLKERLLADAAWLSDQTEKTFAARYQVPDSTGPLLSKPPGSESIRPEASQIRDLGQIRTLTRAGMAVTTVGGFMLFGPFGALVPAIATVATEQGHKHLQAGQVETLSKRIPDLIHEMLEKSACEGRENIKKFYGRIVGDIRMQKKHWMATKFEAIQASRAKDYDEASVAYWNRQLQEIAALLDGLPT